MKHLFVNLFSLVCMLLAGVGLTGCTDDKTEPDPGTWPSLEVKFLEAQYSTVKLEVTAANLTECLPGDAQGRCQGDPDGNDRLCDRRQICDCGRRFFADRK